MKYTNDKLGRHGTSAEPGIETSSPLGFWEWRPERRAAVCSEALADALGLESDERCVSYRRFLKAVHPQDRGRIVEAIRRARRHGRGYRIHCRYRRPNGSEIILYQETADPESEPLPGDRVVGIARDLTRQIRNEEMIRHLAYFDSLTGLPNRVFLSEFINRSLATAKRRHDCFAVLFIDLDNFKRANDAHGHETGDALLREVAKRLTACIRVKRQAPENDDREVTLAVLAPGDIAARLGGDEFVAILPDIGRVENATRVARRIIEALSRPYCIDGNKITISASMGLSFFPWDGRDAGSLLDKADAAMYRAKAAGRRRWVCYGTAGHYDISEALGLAAFASPSEYPDVAAVAGDKRQAPPTPETPRSDRPRGAILPPTELSHWEMTAI